MNKKHYLIIGIIVFMILLGISFISVELTSNLTMILILFLLLAYAFKLIKKMIKMIKTDIKSSYLKEEKQPNHDENKAIYNDTLSTNKEDTVPNNIIKEEPKRKPLFSYADIENLYKHYSIEELEEEINDTSSNLEMLEDELDLYPDDKDMLLDKMDLLNKFQELGKLKISKLKEKQKEINETQNETKSDIEYIEVVGTKYTDAYYILSNVVRDNGGVWDVGGYQEHEIILTLKPEPNNQYDPNAILVTYESPQNSKFDRSGNIGYIPKEVAAKTKLTKSLKVKAIVKEGFKNMYIKIPMKNKATKN